MPSLPLGTVIETVEDDTGPDLLIRSLAPGDAPALLTYINALSAERTFILLQGIQLTLDQEQVWLDDRLAEQAAGDGITLAVTSAATDGRDDRRILGVAEVARGGLLQRHVGVLGISLAAEVRGRGLGSRLLGAVLREAQRHVDGLRLFRLDVFGTNTVAQRLYRRHGFVEYGRLPGGIAHRGDLVDFVSMSRPVEVVKADDAGRA